MSKIWKIIKFYIPSELEGFREKQEDVIEKVLKSNAIAYKFIDQKWALLCDDEIKAEKIQKIKQLFIESLKELFIDELMRMKVERYDKLTGCIYKFIFPENIQIESFDAEIFKKILGLERIQFDETLVEEFKVDVEENILLFRSVGENKYLEEIEIIDKLIKPLSEDTFLGIDINIEIIDKQEIKCSFEVISEDGIEEDAIIDFVQSCKEIQVINEDSEDKIIKEIEYQYGIKSNKSLVHDIRKERILICNYNTYSEIGLLFLGYMKIDDDKIYITIKTFEYEIIDQMINILKKKFNILLETNLLWSRLLSRKAGREYKEKRRNLQQNQLCVDFLNFSTRRHMSDYSLYVLERLLKNGYLTKQEYEEINEPLECAIKDKKDISQFFQKYFRIEKQQIQHKSYWVNSISNKIYFEKESKTDPQRIVDVTENMQKIYAPTEQLLEYIKSFWHQNYVKKIIDSIKDEWDSQNKDLIILEVIPDIQFSLRSKYDKTQKSIDIDILLRLKKKSINKEFIIAVEAKQKSNEIKNSIKELTEKNKISYEYANIFNGFLMIAYIDDMIDENKMKLDCPEYCKVCFKAQQSGFDNIIKPYLLSVDHSFDRLKGNVALNLRKICESTER